MVVRNEPGYQSTLNRFFWVWDSMTRVGNITTRRARSAALTGTAEHEKSLPNSQVQKAWLRDVDLQFLLRGPVSMASNSQDTAQLFVLVLLQQGKDERDASTAQPQAH